MVDWNSWKNGITVCVLGYNIVTKKLRVLNTKIIRKATEEDEENGMKHLQTAGLTKILETFVNFKSKAVYVDEGYGGYQCEYLEKYFFDIGSPEVFKKINFGASLKQINAYTGETISKRLKGVLVYSLQQQFEKSRIELSPIEEGNIENIDARFEDKIVYQLQFYAVDHYDGKDNPVFVNKGDHMLDALMLANYAFIDKIEKSINFLPDKSYAVGIVSNVINNRESIKVHRTSFLEKMEEQILTQNEIKNIEDPKELFNQILQTNDYRINQKSKLLGNKKVKRTSFL